LRLATNE
jgi:hypothetical protein